ncbi:aminopyrimidine aminohydrolase-like [Pecten maximus]|uniref:aminopyrimidine aminohydrolase-like n=1 Tax=Pecten maximus TaxID=6579 RepID=UPI001457E9FE|nr:aminopyrimidine aminohydrolase-like [Pecten maximus]
MDTRATHTVNDPKTKLSARLWESTKGIRDMAINTDFVQGIKNGKLDPEKFGVFCVEDSIYLYKQQHNIKVATEKAKPYPDQYTYLHKRIDSYKTLYEAEFKKWHVGKPEGISLGKDLKEYMDYEEDVALNRQSIYFLVALIPCLKLWPWLGQQIKDGNHGIYNDWAKANLDPDYVGFKTVDALIDEADEKGGIQEDEAMKIYTKCMEGEYKFFNSI